MFLKLLCTGAGRYRAQVTQERDCGCLRCKLTMDRKVAVVMTCILCCLVDATWRQLRMYVWCYASKPQKCAVDLILIDPWQPSVRWKYLLLFHTIHLAVIYSSIKRIQIRKKLLTFNYKPTFWGSNCDAFGQLSHSCTLLRVQYVYNSGAS